MSIPFIPESLESLQKRYPASILITWVAAPNMADTPGKHREHVFDGADGIRIVISRDLTDGIYNDCIHFSASFDERYYTPKNKQEFMKKVTDKFSAISGINKELFEFIVISEAGIPHWKVNK